MKSGLFQIVTAFITAIIAAGGAMMGSWPLVVWCGLLTIIQCTVAILAALNGRK